MIITDSLGIFGQFYSNIKESFKSIYRNSNFYEKKISKTFENSFEYKPSPHLLSSIIKFQNKKYKKKIKKLEFHLILNLKLI